MKQKNLAGHKLPLEIQGTMKPKHQEGMGEDIYGIPPI
jgi:hypothetical protein